MEEGGRLLIEMTRRGEIIDPFSVKCETCNTIVTLNAAVPYEARNWLLHIKTCKIPTPQPPLFQHTGFSDLISQDIQEEQHKAAEVRLEMFGTHSHRQNGETSQGGISKKSSIDLNASPIEELVAHKHLAQPTNEIGPNRIQPPNRSLASSKSSSNSSTPNHIRSPTLMLDPKLLRADFNSSHDLRYPTAPIPRRVILHRRFNLPLENVAQHQIDHQAPLFPVSANEQHNPKITPNILLRDIEKEKLMAGIEKPREDDVYQSPIYKSDMNDYHSQSSPTNLLNQRLEACEEISPPNVPIDSSLNQASCKETSLPTNRSIPSLSSWYPKYWHQYTHTCTPRFLPESLRLVGRGRPMSSYPRAPPRSRNYPILPHPPLTLFLHMPVNKTARQQQMRLATRNLYFRDLTKNGSTQQ